MARIKIKADDLMMAMEDQGGFCSYYLDKETGQIEFVPEDSGHGAEADALAQKVEDEPDRYLGINAVSSSEAYRIMDDFVDSLPDGEEKRLLEKVLSWKKPFSNFKSALYDMGTLRDQWFEFHDKKMQQEMRDWIAYHQLDAELATT